MRMYVHMVNETGNDTVKNMNKTVVHNRHAILYTCI